MKRSVSIISILSLGALTALLVNCAGSSSAVTGGTTVSANKPSTAINAVSSAVSVAGSSMGASGISAASFGNEVVFHPQNISQDCDTHAAPLRAGVAIAQSDQDYPGKFMYCKLAYNTEDEESVQGAFAQVKSISCMLENAGLVFDGQSHTYTVTVDSACWSANQMAHMGGGGGSMSITATGSSPASFNTHYDRGIVAIVPSVGTIQLATKVSATKIEFMETDSLSANNKYGAYAASLDYSTGDLNYELRADRYSDVSDGSSGGFGRHQRVYAKVAVSGTTVTDLISVSAAQVETYNGAVQTGYGGQAITATGSLATGIKARFWSATNGAGGNATGTNDLSNPSKWVETANARCYTSSGPNGGGCSAGIAIPTTNAINSFPFALVGTGFTDCVSWGAAHGSTTFTVTDPSQDIQ